MTQTGLKFRRPPDKIIKNVMAYDNPYFHPLTQFFFWSRFRSGFEYLTSKLTNYPEKKYSRILEIGCGYGFFLPSLCKISEEVIGSDIGNNYRYCYNRTLKCLSSEYENLKLEEINVLKLSNHIDQNSCDVIVAYDVLEHLTKLDKAVKEIQNCLRPSGVFLCGLPSENILYILGRKVARFHDVHKGYDYRHVRGVISSILYEEKTWNVPRYLPLFKIGVYRKEKDYVGGILND